MSRVIASLCAGVICALLFALALYATLILLPFVNLNYLPPFGMVSPLDGSQYSPYTTYIRYAIVILVVPLLYTVLHALWVKKHRYTLRYLFIVILTISYFLWMSSYSMGKNPTLDMFHDGESLGVGSAMYRYGKLPYSDMYFVHGAFADPVLASMSFTLFGETISAYMFVKYTLYIVAFALLFLTLSSVVRSDSIFYLGSLFLFGSDLNLLNRYIPAFVYLLFLSAVIKKKISINLGIFILSLLSTVSFYYSADFGYFLTITNVCVVVGVWMITRSAKASAPFTFPFPFVALVALLMRVLLGMILGVMLGVFSVGIRAYGEFLHITFFVLPRVKPYFDEYVFPTLSSMAEIPQSEHWYPIVCVTLAFCFLWYVITKRRSWLTLHFVLVAALTILAAVSFRHALGRSDTPHIHFVMPFVLFCVVSIIDFFVNVEKSYKSYGVVVLIFSLLFSSSFFNIEKVFAFPQFTVDSVRTFISLPKNVPDSFYLTQDQRDVVAYIQSNTLPDQPVFVFTNESAYYYLFNRRNPTRFYTVWFAQPDFYQAEVVRDLSLNRPKYIMINSDCWCNEIDSLSNAIRLPLVYGWIEQNYVEDQRFGEIILLKGK